MSKRKIALFLALIMIFGMLPMNVLAASFADMPNDWSTQALENAVKNGLLKGSNNMILPKDNLTRAQMAAVISRAFGTQGLAKLDSYKDIPKNAWFSDDMAKAVHMKVIQGDGVNLRPNDSITREEAFVVLSRAFKVEKNHSLPQGFTDLDDIALWAKDAVYSLINEGYIKGSNGKINPKGNISRAEFAQVMDNLVKEYISKSGEYTKDLVGTTIINTPDVVLKDITVDGDLIIGDGVGQGDVTLENTNIKGRLVVRGGGENSIIIRGTSTVNKVIIAKVDGVVRVFNDTGVEIGEVVVDGSDDIILEGHFSDVVIDADDIVVNTNNSTIKNVTINSENTKLEVKEGSKIENTVVNGKGNIVSGAGEVQSIEVNESNSSISIEGAKVTVGKEANDVVVNGTTTQPGAVVEPKPVTPPPVYVPVDTRVKVTITSKSQTVTYNGEEHTVADYEVLGLPEGFILTEIEATRTETNSGEYDVEFTGTPKIINEEDEDKTSDFNITLVKGKLVIDPIDIRITANSSTKMYDGTPLVNDGFEVTGDFVVGEGVARVLVEGSQTYVGVGTNSIKSHELDEGTLEQNYNIEYVNGELEITPANIEIEVTADSDSKVYDGISLSKNTWQLTEGQLIDGDELVVTINGSITDVGVVDNKVDLVKVMNKGTDVSVNYSVTIVNGSLEVTKKDVVITAESDDFVYDGTNKSNSNYEVVGLVGSDNLNVIIEGSIKYPKDSPVVNTVKSHTFVTGKAENYEVSYVHGELTMEEANLNLVIKANSKTKAYDGNELVDDGFTLVSGDLMAGDIIVATVAGTITDAGTVKNVITEVKVMNGDVDVTNNYFISKEEGTIEVTKKTVTIVVDNKSKIFDTDNPEFTGTITGLVDEGDLGIISYVLESSETEVGEYPGTINVTFTPNNNYEVVVTKGNWSIVEAQGAALIVNGYNGTYDGGTHSITVEQLLPGDEVSYSVNNGTDWTNEKPVFRNVGTYTVLVKTTNTNYEDRTGMATVVISPRTIDVKANNGSKVYDGNPLINTEWELNSGSLVNGDELIVTVDGTITNVGQVSNEIVEVKVLNNSVDVTSNYLVNKISGTLEVTKKEAVIEVNDSAKGFGENDPLFTANISGLVNDMDLGVVTYNRISNQEDVGVYEDDITAMYTVNPNYSVIVINGDLTISATSGESLIVKGYNGTYDGEYHSVTIENLYPGDTVYYSTTNNGTDWSIAKPEFKDSSTSIIYIKITNPNYNDRTGFNTVRITPIKISIQASSAQKVYDSLPLKNQDYSIIEGDFVDTEGFSNVYVVGEQTEVGSSNNVIEGYTFNTSTLEQNYVIEVYEGTLIVLDNTYITFLIEDAIDIRSITSVDVAEIRETFNSNPGNISGALLDIDSDNNLIKISLPIDSIYIYQEEMYEYMNIDKYVFSYEIEDDNDNKYFAYFDVEFSMDIQPSVKSVSLKDFRSIDIKAEGISEEHLVKRQNLYLLDDNGKSISFMPLEFSNHKLQPGLYSVTSIVDDTPIPYYIYSEANVLDSNIEINHPTEDFVKITRNFDDYLDYDQGFDSIGISKYSVTSNILTNSDELYVLKGTYSGFSSAFEIDYEGNKYKIDLIKSWDEGITFVDDTVIEIDNSFKVSNYNYNTGNVVLSTDYYSLTLRQFFNGLFIENSNGARIYRIDKVDEVLEFDYYYDMKVTLGETEYNKTVSNIDLYSLSIQDIIGYETELPSNFSIEVSQSDFEFIFPAVYNFEIKDIPNNLAEVVSTVLDEIVVIGEKRISSDNQIDIKYNTDLLGKGMHLDDLEMIFNGMYNFPDLSIDWVNYDGVNYSWLEDGVSLLNKIEEDRLGGQKNYEFKVGNESSESTFYHKITTEYSVEFVDRDDNLLSWQFIEEGFSATPPDAPVVEGYSFIGWDSSYANIQEDKVIKALYSEGEGQIEAKLTIEGIDDILSKDSLVSVSSKGLRPDSNNYWQTIGYVNIDYVKQNIVVEDNKMIISIPIQNIEEYEEFSIQLSFISNNEKYIAYLNTNSIIEPVTLSLADFVNVNITLDIFENGGAENYSDTNLYLFNDQEIGVSDIIYGHDKLRIQPGKYSFATTIGSSNEPYYMYTPILDVVDENSGTYEHKFEDLVLVERDFEQYLVGATFTLKSFGPIKYNSATHINSSSEKFYATKDHYSGITYSLHFEYETKKYAINYVTGSVDLRNSIKNYIISSDDKFRIATYLDDDNSRKLSFNSTDSYIPYFYISNSYGDRLSNFNAFVGDSIDYSYQTMFKVSIIVDETTKYEKTINRNSVSSTKFMDITDGEPLPKNFKLEVSVVDFPLVEGTTYDVTIVQ